MCHFTRRAMILFALSTSFFASPQALEAIDIRIQNTTDFDGEENPSWDEDAAILMAHAESAARIWESLLPANHTFEVWIEWDDDIGGLGRWFPTLDPTWNIIELNSSATWFTDPTPHNNNEFRFLSQTTSNPNNQGQTLYRNLTADQQTSWFPDTPPPGVLEVGYRGSGISGICPGSSSASLCMGASGVTNTAGADLLSTLLHEMGHEMGINWDEPGNYNIYPHHIGGTNDVVVAEDLDAFDAHLWGDASGTFLMCDGCGSTGVRRLPTASDIFVIAEENGFNDVNLERTEFIGGNNFHDPALWIGNRLPDSHDFAGLRSNPASNLVLSSNVTVEELLIDSMNQLATSSRSLIANRSATVQGGGQLSVDASGLLLTTQLTVTGAGSALRMFDSTVSVVNDLSLASGGLLSGFGTVQATNKVANDGVIEARFGTLTLDGSTMLSCLASDGITPVACLDLDGPLETGEIEALQGNVTVSGLLVDDFSGVIRVGAGRTIAFNNGWMLANAGRLDLGGAAGNAARLDGGIFAAGEHANLSGTVNALGDAVIDADAWFRSTADVVVLRPGDRLDITGFTRYEGGNYTGSGTIRQSGQATVRANTTIGVTTFDWDGAAESTTATTINPGVEFRLNVQQIEQGDPLLDGYDGFVEVHGGTLNVNTPAPWRLDGTIRLSDGAEVRGSTIRLFGRIDTDAVLPATATIFAPLDMQSGAIIEAGSAGDTIVLAGNTMVSGASDFAGFGGTLRQVGNLTVGANMRVQSGLNYDWDGNDSMPSTTTVNAGVTLTIGATSIDSGTPTTDGYDGILNIAGGTLDVSVPRSAPVAWRMDGTMNLAPDAVNNAVVSGASPLRVHGSVNVNGAGLARVRVPVDFRAASSVAVNAAGGTLRLESPITYQSGSYSGPGTIDQRATATVTANTTIGSPVSRLGTYDWDGSNEGTPSTTTVSAGAAFTLNVDRIEPGNDPAAEGFDGRANVNGGTLSVNVPTLWRLDGEVRLVETAGQQAVLAGSTILNMGEISATGRGIVMAPIEMEMTSVLRVANATDTLTLAGATTYRELAAFAGQGTLVQRGNATVTGPSDNDGVNVGIFDWDGSEGSPSNMTIAMNLAQFGPGEAFVINADQIEQGDPTADGYDGVLSLDAHRLIVNTTGPWRLDRTLNLTATGGNLPQIEGSHVVIHGSVVPSGSAVFNNEVTFRETAQVSLDATETLHFNRPVTYRGGTYTGAGTIKHNFDAIVDAATTIGVGVMDLDGAIETGGIGLKITAGGLTLNVNSIDATNNIYDGELVLAAPLTVNTPAPWTVTGGIRMVGSGAIFGASLTTTGLVTGAGTIGTAGWINNGRVSADGGTLLITTATFPDLDGGRNNSTVEALSGDIRISSPLAGRATFGGTLSVGAGRSLFIESGGLHNLGTVNLAGRLVAESFVQEARLNVDPGDAMLRGDLSFLDRSQNILNGDLLLTGTAAIHKGAVFSGRGNLIVGPGADLRVGEDLGVSVVNQSFFRPGLSPGIVRVAGDYTQEPSGGLHIELTGRDNSDPARAQFDQVLVDRSASLDGELQIELVDRFVPLVGEEFVILMAGSRQGIFDRVSTSSDSMAGFSWQVSYTDEKVQLTFAGLAGDIDSDGDVDDHDAALFTRHLGRTSGSVWRSGDFDFDGATTLLDLSLLQANLRRTLNSPAAVPEPTTWMLAPFGLVILAWRRAAFRRTKARAPGTGHELERRLGGRA
jgi:hypothetical protein